ncbi:MAG: hypothetical protein PF442_01695 [Desulfobulbaceae bacterium]|jgi:hypothetical protein|nr:hypothetical protein [Desulfobulbaceae bacterium]
MKYVLTILAIFMLTVPAYGKGNGKNKQHKHEDQYGDQASNKHDLPPGLQKKAARGKALPPGWQKKIAKGKRVDDDLYQHMHPVDGATLRILPPLGYGEAYHSIEDDIVKLKQDGREILEVIKRSKLPLPPPPPPPFF